MLRNHTKIISISIEELDRVCSEANLLLMYATWPTQLSPHILPSTIVFRAQEHDEKFCNEQCSNSQENLLNWWQ
jgi:predicted nucleic acid-binding Zn ribbon protein